MATVKSHFFAVFIFSQFKTSEYHNFVIFGPPEVKVTFYLQKWNFKIYILLRYKFKFWLEFEQINVYLNGYNFKISDPSSCVRLHMYPQISREFAGVSQNKHMHVHRLPEASTKCMRIEWTNQNPQRGSENLKLYPFTI